MVAMGKAARVRPQAGPSYQRTDLLRRTRTGAICPARRWTKKGIISSSHPLMPSSAVSLFFMLFFELTPCDFLIVGALNRLPSDRLAWSVSSVNVFW